MTKKKSKNKNGYRIAVIKDCLDIVIKLLIIVTQILVIYKMAK
ncbi:hypothetical protein [Lactobacillus mulieris]|nr:hypothetical protein [Lactobacillus mulieris]